MNPTTNKPQAIRLCVPASVVKTEAMASLEPREDGHALCWKDADVVILDCYKDGSVVLLVERGEKKDIIEVFDKNEHIKDIASLKKDLDTAMTLLDDIVGRAAFQGLPETTQEAVHAFLKSPPAQVDVLQTSQEQL